MQQRHAISILLLAWLLGGIAHADAILRVQLVTAEKPRTPLYGAVRVELLNGLPRYPAGTEYTVNFRIRHLKPQRSFTLQAEAVYQDSSGTQHTALSNEVTIIINEDVRRTMVRFEVANGIIVANGLSFRGRVIPSAPTRTLTLQLGDVPAGSEWTGSIRFRALGAVRRR